MSDSEDSEIVKCVNLDSKIRDETSEIDDIILRTNQNTDYAMTEITRDIKSFWACCIGTIPQIKAAGLSGREAFLALINSAKEHESEKMRNIAIALENNSIDSITNRFGSSRYHSGIIDDKTYVLLSNLRNDINAEISQS